MEKSNTPAPRTTLHVEVHFRKSYARDESVGTLKNISLTGAFLRSNHQAFKSGEKIHLSFKVSGRQRDIHAQVVWTNQFGCGVKFLPQNNRDRQIVDDLIYFVESKKSGHKDVLDLILQKVA